MPTNEVEIPVNALLLGVSLGVSLTILGAMTVIYACDLVGYIVKKLKERNAHAD